jgi:hypothetical protein
MTKLAVLLTATIRCANTPLVERADAKLREADYRWALRGWLETKGLDTLIFCENSGAPLDDLRDFATRQNRVGASLVFLSCSKNSGAREFGKGYGEIEIIRHAINHTPDIDLHRLILKVTGRYRARNAEQLLRELRSTHEDILCSLRLNLTTADSRIFAITPACATNQLVPRQSTINDSKGRFFEHALADAVHGTILSGGSWSPLPREPLIYGISGTEGTRFGFSPIRRLGKSLRHALVKACFSYDL